MKILVLRTHISKAIAAMALVTLPVNLALAAGETGGGDGFASLIPLILIMVIFYFLLIRPQQKRLKTHGEMIKNLKKGDKVITGGGLFATVIDVKEQHLKVEIADGVRVKVKQDTILNIITADKPAD